MTLPTMNTTQYNTVHYYFYGGGNPKMNAREWWFGYVKWS